MTFDVSLPGFETVMPGFAHGSLAMAAVSGLAIALLALTRPDVPILRPSVLVVGVCIHVASVGGLLIAMAHPGILEAGVEAFSAVAGLCSGFGTLVLALHWASYFSSYDLRNILLRLCLLLSASAIVNTVFAQLSADAQLAFYFLSTLAGTLGPLWRQLHCRMPDEHPGVTSDLKPATALRRLFSVVGVPFVGFLLFALTMAVRKVLVLDFIFAEGLGTVAEGLIVAPLCFTRLEKPLMPFVYQVFLPVVAATLILVNSLPGEGVGAVPQALGLYVFFGIIGILALVLFTATAGAREFSVPLRFGFALSAFCVVSLIGLAFRDIPLIGEGFDLLLLSLSTLYLVYLMLSPGLRAWRSMYAPAEGDAASPAWANFVPRLEQLAALHGLSQRESEIMAYIGRGYSPAFIAKKLFLSDSTVRSHVKNIYRKLEVSSREELFWLIDSGMGEEGLQTG
jgi:DNA-binding CsgD family transcriptional regulator